MRDVKEIKGMKVKVVFNTLTLQALRGSVIDTGDHVDEFLITHRLMINTHPLCPIDTNLN